MPAFYAGKRVGKPLLNGHTYNALFNGKLVWPLDKDTVVSIEITDDKGKPLPKSLAVSGTLKLGARSIRRSLPACTRSTDSSPTPYRVGLSH